MMQLSEAMPWFCEDEFFGSPLLGALIMLSYKVQYLEYVPIENYVYE